MCKYPNCGYCDKCGRSNFTPLGPYVQPAPWAQPVPYTTPIMPNGTTPVFPNTLITYCNTGGGFSA